MKTRFLTISSACFLFVVMLFGSEAFSQDMAAAMKDKTPEQKAQGLTMLMKVKLLLDTAETTKVGAINLKYAQKTDPIIKGDQGKFAKFKALKELQKSKDAELKGVLTADQFKQYQDMEEQIKEKMMENAKNGKAAN
jgi:hypothetical protein